MLAANVATGTDLNSLASVAGSTSIRLRANLSTTNSANTSRLDDWTVSSFSALAQTFLSAWSDVVSSTQDATAPQLAITSATTSALAFHVVTGTASDASGIDSITINGAPAETTDGFAHWRSPQLHLAPGPNAFTIAIADRAVPANTATTPWSVTFTAAAADLDGNGLPDAWEAAHGLDPADDATGSPRQGPAGDFDGDGLPNLLELALGLDPAAPNPDALPFATIEKNPDDNRNDLVFTFVRPFGSSAFTFHTRSHRRARRRMGLQRRALPGNLRGTHRRRLHRDGESPRPPRA